MFIHWSFRVDIKNGIWFMSAFLIWGRQVLFLYYLRRNVWGPNNSAKKSSIYHHIPREILQCISLIHKEENENRFLKMLLLWSIRVIIKIHCLVHCHVFSCRVIYSTKIFTVKIKRLLWWEFCEKKVSGMMSLLYEINFSCPLKVYPW